MARELTSLAGPVLWRTFLGDESGGVLNLVRGLSRRKSVGPVLVRSLGFNAEFIENSEIAEKGFSLRGN